MRMNTNRTACNLRYRLPISSAERRHARLLKRGLSGANPTLLELKGEHEACLVAKVRARLLLALANCSALPDARVAGEETGGGDAVLRRVRDAADTILGEVLQVSIEP